MRIGVTGGMGSGKSYVCRLLEVHWGLPVYDCDLEAKRLITSSTTLRDHLRALVGPSVFDADGTLNKAVMGSFLFANDEHLQQVNGLVHPLVKADFLAWAQRQQGDVVVESAILVEAGMRDVVDYLIVVEAPEAMRIERAMQRDHATETQVCARIKHQLPSELLHRMADSVVVNDGRDLMPQLKTIIHI